jgi:hypothetical protein
MTKLRPVKGARPSSPRRRGTPATREVVFLPEGPMIHVVERDTYYAMSLRKPVLVTVESDAVSYEPID